MAVWRVFRGQAALSLRAQTITVYVEKLCCCSEYKLILSNLHVVLHSCFYDPGGDSAHPRLNEKVRRARDNVWKKKTRCCECQLQSLFPISPRSPGDETPRKNPNKHLLGTGVTATGLYQSQVCFKLNVNCDPVTFTFHFIVWLTLKLCSKQPIWKHFIVSIWER